jgi:hypothetical protein
MEREPTPSEERDGLLTETIARHFPEARLDKNEVELQPPLVIASSSESPYPLIEAKTGALPSAPPRNSKMADWLRRVTGRAH